MIDFTNCEERLNGYKGSEKKKTLLYNGKRYLVKFPDPVREKNKDISYINNAFSEYVGSHIFELVGMKTQKTILGTYTYNKKQKIVCACEDFTSPNIVLYEFENLALSTNPDKKIDTELTDILSIIDEIKMIDKQTIKNFFWDMFVVDAFIGNTDRHNGNWGFLLNTENLEMQLAPIFDCGSCLNPMLEDEKIEKFEEYEIKNLAINSYSCFKIDNKKINSLTYIQTMKNLECNDALMRIIPKIEIDMIFDFINNIPCISYVRKEFYKKMLSIRYENLKSIYNLLLDS